MGIIWLRWRAELRTHWRVLVVTALLVGIGGGVTLSVFAGARRTDTTMANFVSYSLPDDGGFLYGNPANPTVPPRTSGVLSRPLRSGASNPVAPPGEELVRSAVLVPGHRSIRFGRGNPQSVRGEQRPTFEGPGPPTGDRRPPAGPEASLRGRGQRVCGRQAPSPHRQPFSLTRIHIRRSRERPFSPRVQRTRATSRARRSR